jgi:hypothetical protein
MQGLNNACTRYAFSGKYAPDYNLEQKIKRRKISGKSGYLANSKWESVHHTPPPKKKKKKKKPRKERKEKEEKGFCNAINVPVCIPIPYSTSNIKPNPLYDVIQLLFL